MTQNSLLALLQAYTPATELEKSMCEDIVRFVKENPLCFERTLAIGHVTASGWVVSPDRSMVLLMHHRKLDRWFQPGGHCDGDPDVQHVARKEVEEETGLTDFKLSDAGIFDVDVHLIPANSKDEAHYHYDIRFLFEADPDQSLVLNRESRELRWVETQNIVHFNDSESILRMVQKTSIL